MENLKQILKEAGIKHQDISNNLGIRSLSTVSQKVNHKSTFSVMEAIKLRNMIYDKTSKKYLIEELFAEGN